MKKDYLFYQRKIEECYIKQGKPFHKVSEMILKSDLQLIDEYTGVVLDTFTSHGLQEDSEPNKHGLALEDVIDYLLELRYAIVN